MSGPPSCSNPRIGCLGAAWCDYCGRPLVHRDARARLSALIDRLTARPRTEAST